MRFPFSAWNGRAVLRELMVVSLLALCAVPTAWGQNVLTQHNDNARTGANRNETILKPSNLGANEFGKIFFHYLDGQVYAQPLFMKSVAIANKGVHNVVFVATQHNSVYAFDADSAEGDNASPLWHVNLTPSGATTVPNWETGSGDIQPEIGITGTPVIDASAQTLYVVAKFKRNDGTYGQNLHALNIGNGSNKLGGPVLIEGQVNGTGDGSENGILPFNTLRQMQRPALLLSKGVLYVAFSAHGDVLPYHGWVFAYNASTLKKVGLHCTSPDGKTDPSGYPLGGGGIWMAGGGPAADAQGNLYFLTGNGTFSAPSKGTGIDFGDSFVKLAPTPNFNVLDYFTPFNEDNLNRADADLGSGGLTLLPESVGSTAHPRLLVGAGKEGKVYLIDRDNMGKFHADTDAVVQSLPGAVGGVWGKPAYYNGKVYFLGNGDVLKAFGISNGELTLTPVSQGTEYFDYPGAVPSISSNGDTNGIAWVIKRGDMAVLQAYDAEDLTKKLYDSGQTDGRDNTGPYIKFTVPTVANGKVFVGTSNSLEVFGRGKWVAKPVISPPGGSFYPNVEVRITCATPGATIRYTTDGSDPGEFSPVYTDPFVVSSCTLVRAQAVLPGYAPSAIALASFIIDEGAGNGDGLFADYYTDPDDGTHFGQFVLRRVDPNIDFQDSGQSPAPGLMGYNWSARWTGFLLPRCTGTYNFATYTDDGVRVWINNQLVIDNWTYHGPMWDYGTIELQAGQKVPIKVEFFQGYGASYMRLLWSPTGGPYEVVPQDQLFTGRQLKARTPVILPRSGTFQTSQKVTITTASSGAEIRYTLDGTEPSASSLLYTGPLTVNASAVVRAKTFLLGAIPSDAATTFYAKNPNPRTYRINAGGLNASPFTADQFFNGGEGHSRVGAVDTSLVVDPAPQAVYEAERFSNAFGNFYYHITGLQASTAYLVRLHFEDSDYFNAGERLFNVLMNGNYYLVNYDINADAGAPFKAVVKEFVVTSGSDGTIDVSFDAVYRPSKISGIEVVPALPVSGIVGTGDGVRGSYYDDLGFTGKLLTRTDETIYFDWGGGSPDPSMGEDLYSVRWDGYVQPPYSGEYNFHTLTDDGIRLWIDDKLVINNWTDHAPYWDTGSIALRAGRKYKLRMEMYENYGGAVAQLFWSGPRTSLDVVPKSQLYTQASTTVSGKVTYLECLNPTAHSVTLLFRPVSGSAPFERAVSLAANGSFSVANLPQDHYEIALLEPHYLRRVMTADASSGPAEGVRFDLIPGDANDDNSVDIFDLATLAEAFNSEPGDFNYNPACDFNCDTHVNIFDLAVLAKYFFTEGDK